MSIDAFLLVGGGGETLRGGDVGDGILAREVPLSSSSSPWRDEDPFSYGWRKLSDGQCTGLPDTSEGSQSQLIRIEEIDEFLQEYEGRYDMVLRFLVSMQENQDPIHL
ncbi:hypothetical protein Tco_0814993 [Tanacetum coccineum]